MPETTPFFVRASVVSALVGSIVLVVCYESAAHRPLAPGVGRLGAEPGALGRRTAWSRVSVPSRAADVPPSPVLGDALYATWCAACHGESGAGDGAVGRALSPPARDFTRARFRFRTTPEGSLPSDGDLFRTITAGVLPSGMPAFAFLAAEERWALVAKVKRLSRYFDEDERKDVNWFESLPPEPEVAFPRLAAVDAGSVERGKRLYESKAECWKCHGTSGRADGPSAPTLLAEEGTPLLPANLRRGPLFFKMSVDEEDVARVLRLGMPGTPMASYAGALDDGEIRDVVRYVASLWDLAPPPSFAELPLGSRALSHEDSRIALGERTYRASCAGCHGLSGRGDGPASALLDPQPANLAAGVFKLKSTAEGCFPDPADVFRTIRHGVPGTAMSAWELPTDAEVEALVAYFRRLGEHRTRPRETLPAPRLPAAWNDGASVAGGRALFAANCGSCHGSEGRGDGPWASILQDYRGERLRPRNLVEEPFKAGREPEIVFRTVSYAFEGTPMPGFATVLSEPERWQLVAYVLSLAGARP